MEEQKLMQLIAEMIQAKVTPQEMIGKLTQMGLSEDQAISAVKMVASKLNGDQEQPEKMQNGDAIQPAAGQAIEPDYKYEFSQRSVDAGKNKEYAHLLSTASRAGYSDVKQDVDGNWTAQTAVGGKRVPVKVSGNRAYTMEGPRGTIQKEQPWLSQIVANSRKPNLNMQAPAPQLLAGSSQPTQPLMENGGNLQFYKKGGKMAPAKSGKKEKKCSCGCKLVLKKVGGKITEQCGCGCKVKK